MKQVTTKRTIIKIIDDHLFSSLSAIPSKTNVAIAPPIIAKAKRNQKSMSVRFLVILCCSSEITGCGSGSISVEAAIQIEDSGHVHAVDYDPKAVELTKKNLAKFGISNISVIGKNADEAISELPEADTIFVGGTGKDTTGIVKMCLEKLKPGGRIVVEMIQIETIFSVLSFVQEQGLNSVDITQVTISKSRKTSTGTMMLARNPVTILSATKN